jgi:Putative transposase, YhgA-like
VTRRRSRWKEIGRKFPENGIKLLLEDPRNVADLLPLTGDEIVGLIDFSGMSRVPTSFIGRDFRHLESDVLLKAPLRLPDHSDPNATVWVYILIEHQSEPDEWMPFRLLEYIVQIFRSQQREWRRTHKTLQGFRFSPVVPMVFYTGLSRWDNLGTLSQLVTEGSRFGRLIPHFEPLFLGLGQVLPETLETEGGYFGWALRLLQEREGRPDEFRALAERVLNQLAEQSGGQRERWLELLSYLHALVYYNRANAEHVPIHQLMEESARSGLERKEIKTMVWTMADALKEEGRAEGEKKGREEGRIEGRKDTLVEQLKERFGEIPEKVIQKIRRTKDARLVDTWIKRVLSAATLDEMQIFPRK